MKKASELDLTFSMPLLTVGLPVFNGEQYLEMAIDSLLSQSYSDFILLISDNSSTDRTNEIASKYANQDSRIRLFRQTENIGAINNYRFLFQTAETPYFMFSAADDTWSSNWIETLLPVAKMNDCVAYGVNKVIDLYGEEIPNQSANRRHSFTGPRLVRRVQYFASPAALGKANPINGIFYKKLFSEDVWREFSKFRNAPDVMALYEFVRNSKIRFVSDAYHNKRFLTKSTASVESFAPQNKRIFRKTQLPDYLRTSSIAETVILLLAYPIALGGTYWAKVIRLKVKIAARRKKARLQ